MKTVGRDAFCTYHILYHYFQKCKKYKNRPIVKRSKRQADDIILDACMKFESYPIKTVGEDAFYSNYISYNYFKTSKNSKIVQSSKKYKPG